MTLKASCPFFYIFLMSQLCKGRVVIGPLQMYFTYITQTNASMEVIVAKTDLL